MKGGLNDRAVLYSASGDASGTLSGLYLSPRYGEETKRCPIASSDMRRFS